MKRLYIFIILLFLVGCGSNNKDTDEQNSSSNIVNISDNNSSSNSTISDIVNNNDLVNSNVTKIGKAQLGVISNGTVKLYELSGADKKLLTTEKTTVGDRIDEIGNFNLNIEKLNNDKYYLYEVSGGDDYDIEDDGIINSVPKSNKGIFHLIAKGSTIKKANKIYITIISEIVYQKVLPYLNSSDIEDRLNSVSMDIIDKDITGDSAIDFFDIISYNPITNRDNLNTYYKNSIFSMITNILNGQKYDFKDDIYLPDSTTEAEIQKKLDSGDYAYVLNQLLNNRDAYRDMSDDKIDMNIAAAYVGQSGYTVFDITSAMANSSSKHSLNSFVLDTTKDNNPLSTLENLEKAQEYYNSVINGVDCNDTNLTKEQKDSCFNLGLVKLTYLSNSVKMLFNSDEDLVKNWANGVDINSTDDLNGNSVPDKSDSSSCAIVYANNPMDNCRDGSMATYRKKVTFKRLGKEYNLTMIDVDVGNSALGFNTFNELVTHKDNNNSAILTDGICDLDFNKTTTHNVDGVTYFPCPVIDKNGTIMNIADSLTNASNIQNLFPSGSDTKTTAENYIKNITGSKDGVIDQNNLSTYLQSH